jgi:hypothetical protein
MKRKVSKHLHYHQSDLLARTKFQVGSSPAQQKKCENQNQFCSSRSTLLRHVKSFLSHGRADLRNPVATNLLSSYTQEVSLHRPSKHHTVCYCNCHTSPASHRTQPHLIHSPKQTTWLYNLKQHLSFHQSAPAVSWLNSRIRRPSRGAGIPRHSSV